MQDPYSRTPGVPHMTTTVLEVEDKCGHPRQFGVMYMATVEERPEHEVDEQAAIEGRPLPYRQVMRRHVRVDVQHVYIDGIEVTPILHAGILYRLESAAKRHERQFADARKAEAA